MKKSLAALATFAVVGLGASVPAHAWLPQGSYDRTCTRCDMRGDWLQCVCRTRDGRMIGTRLKASDCGGPIANMDGRLTCQARRPAPPPPLPFFQPTRLPPGSWARTCTNAAMNGNVLSAVCRMRDGRMMPTRLNVRGCRSEIANLDGRLSCAR